jgi:parvulin-like peptidyl-prolyl isomerase
MRADHIQCEKHAKKEEALAKLKAGAKFDDVARDFSEDKARAGRLFVTEEPPRQASGSQTLILSG